MSTEIWFRNPEFYSRELVECGEYHIIWDRGYLVKKTIDPMAHAKLYWGKTFPWRLLLIGDQGTAEYRDGDHWNTPTAVYPTWVYGDETAFLEELLAYPVGQDPLSCSDLSVPGDERPVLGQEHRVVISYQPTGNSGPGRKFLQYLKVLQEDYPDAIIHIHNLYSHRLAFGLGFRSADLEVRHLAAHKKITIPSGKEILAEHANKYQKWITLLGFKIPDLTVPRNRCMYNIKSSVWASEHYDEQFNFKTRKDNQFIDYDTPKESFVPAETISNGITRPVSEGDKFLCDTCSLQDQCKYFRSGAVCSVPGAEPIKLSKMFNTRDADMIIDGLGTLVAANTNRLERGMRLEEMDGDIDPEVTKMVGQVFDQGVKLAKLLEPQRFSPSTKVQVNVGAGAGSASVAAGGNPRQLVSAAFRELESQGIQRKDITPQMILGVFEGMASPEAKQKAIAGTVVSVKDDM